MRKVLLLVVLCAIPASAAVHAVIPGCCTSVLWALNVMDATNVSGGANNAGTVFSLSVGLARS